MRATHVRIAAQPFDQKARRQLPWRHHPDQTAAVPERNHAAREAGQKIVVAERAGGARHARKGLDPDAVMEGKGAHIIGVGQDALGDQHAVGAGAGLRRPQFGGGQLRRRHADGEGSRFPGRGRAGRESVPGRDRASEARQVSVRSLSPGPALAETLTGDMAAPRPKVQNKAQNKMLRCARPDPKRRNQQAKQHMRVLPISLSGYHRKMRGPVLAALSVLLASWALPESAQAQPHVQPPQGDRAGAVAVSGILGPAAASGTARSLAPVADPLHDRDRLSAVQLCRARTAIRSASMSIWRG